ncbi:hypothetical protein APHAL10511_000860 [Amanita phalloides]|nr:hypothetical protein APHAL10511_000860 [Amanita phalloides]
MLRALLVAVTAVATVSFANAKLSFLGSSGSYGKQLLENTTFDYIVVGGGTAGLTVARRLTDSSSKRVLVIEPGGSGFNNPLVTVPGNEYQFIGTSIDWLYFTQPQVHAANLSINLSSGKILGGDSSVNGLVWVRPPVAEYDAFEALGNAGWNWDSMYAAMKKSERLIEPTAADQAKYGYYAVPSSHGTNGPINVTFPPFIPLQHQKFVKASIELGHDFNTDPYSGDNTGSFWSLSSQNSSSVRVSAEFGYLDPILGRENLIVFSGGLVTRLGITDGPEITAHGVFVRFPDGSEQLARLAPDGEVIMSAGTIRTPQILELSGIGNKDILDKFDIDVLLDLPAVGENYEDHTITLLTYQLKPGYLSADALKYNATFLAEQEELYTQNKGFFTFGISGVVMAPMENILNANEIKTAKQILSVKPPTISQDSFDIIKSQIFSGVPQIEFLLFDSFSTGGKKLPNTSYASLAITQVHPLSRGSIHINSSSIDDHPLIDPNVLESDWDRWFLAKATAYARRFFQTEAMLDVFESTEVYPGSSVQTQDQWEQYVTHNINIGYHSVGTSSLLPRDKNGVVDANLMIYGAKNIRVVDASIMPLLISAHTQPAAYAIGERAAEIIMRTW